MTDFSNTASPIDVSLEALEDNLRLMSQPCYQIRRPQLIVSPEMKARIDMDPALQETARIALGITQ